MERYGVATICAASALAVGSAMMGHEAAHVITGAMAGGSPTLMTATEVRGEFGELSPAGFVIFGASGSVVNVLFCALGAWLLSRRSGGAALRLSAWFFLAVNGFLVTTKMMAEPLTGFGDWMTILRPLPATGASRCRAAVGRCGTDSLLTDVTDSLTRFPGHPTRLEGRADLQTQPADSPRRRDEPTEYTARQSSTTVDHGRMASRPACPSSRHRE